MNGIILDGYALNPGDLSYDGLRALADFEERDFTSPDELVPLMKDKEIAITNKVPFDRAAIEALPGLKYIGVTATGYNIIDTEAAREHGVAVTNIPAYSTQAVAQHVFAFLLALANRIETHDRSVKAGDWDRSRAFCYWKTPLFELSGKRIGIIGLGNIGRQVALIAKAFGMSVAAYSPHSRMEGVENLPLESLLSSCDIISLHCPLTPDTQRIINEKSLSAVRRGSILINASRGPLVDPEAVVRALDDGTLSWYCADVLDMEPPRGDVLTRHERTLITPHIAWAPKETRERLLGILVENLKSYLDGGKLNRIV